MVAMLLLLMMMMVLLLVVVAGGHLCHPALHLLQPLKDGHPELIIRNPECRTDLLPGIVL